MLVFPTGNTVIYTVTKQQIPRIINILYIVVYHSTMIT